MKAKKTGVVPKLRFPEFRDAGEWPLKLAGELFHNRIERGAEDLPIYSVTTDSGMVKRSSLDRKIDDLKNFEGNKKVCKSDIAYNMMRMWQGAFGIAPEDCMVSPAYVVLEPQKGVSSDFFGQVLKTPQSLRRLTSQSHGLTEDRLRLYYKDFAQIPLVFPIPEEQEKVADFLTSLDELISVQSRKIEALKTYKCSLMQQLFPRDGETVPRLRFPEFREAGDWAEAPLNKLITTITPPAKLPTSNYQKVGKYPVVDQSQQVICGWTDNADALVDVSSPLIVFGDHTCVLKLIRQSFAQGADGIKIFKAKAEISSEFLYHSLSHRPLLMEDYKRHFTSLRERRVYYPDIVTGEQKRIAEFLSSLDELIVAQGRKVEAQKLQRQALMQKLFPAAEEMDT